MPEGLTSKMAQVASGDPHGMEPFDAEVSNVNENPDYRHQPAQDFRVLVPWSGGMDSTALVLMATDAGLPVLPIYIDTGAPYSEHERALLPLLKAACGLPAIELQLPIDYERWGVIDKNRNGVILAAVAEMGTDCGWWGHIWFGNTGDPGETTWRGGDKSFWFVTEMNVQLAAHQLPWTVQSPLIGLTKGDVLRLLISRNRGALEWTLSCTSGGATHCRECVSCAMRWLAYQELGVDVWPETDMRPALVQLHDKRVTQRRWGSPIARAQRNLIDQYNRRREQ